MNDLPALYLPETDSDDHPIVNFLENHGIGFLDRSDASAGEASQETGIPEDEVTRQYPLVKWTDGTLLKECDTDQLVAFLRSRDYEFEDS